MMGTKYQKMREKLMADPEKYQEYLEKRRLQRKQRMQELEPRPPLPGGVHRADQRKVQPQDGKGHKKGRARQEDEVGRASQVRCRHEIHTRGDAGQ